MRFRYYGDRVFDSVSVSNPAQCSDRICFRSMAQDLECALQTFRGLGQLLESLLFCFALGEALRNVVLALHTSTVTRSTSRPASVALKRTSVRKYTLYSRLVTNTFVLRIRQSVAQLVFWNIAVCYTSYTFACSYNSTLAFGWQLCWGIESESGMARLDVCFRVRRRSRKQR